MLKRSKSTKTTACTLTCNVIIVNSFLIISFCIIIDRIHASTPRFNTEYLRQVPAPSTQQINNAAKIAQLPSSLKIPDEWLPYLNPAFENFWSEGAHKPDAGFILFARNPSAETAKMWLLRGEIKARYLELMYPLVQDAQKSLVASGYLKDRFKQFSDKNLDKLKPIPALSKSQAANIPSDIAIYFLFDSKCPFCQQLAITLKTFANNVVPLQVNGTELFSFEGLSTSQLASDETKKQYLSGKLPVLLIYSTSKSKMTKLEGAVAAQDILAAIAAVGG